MVSDGTGLRVALYTKGRTELMRNAFLTLPLLWSLL